MITSQTPQRMSPNTTRQMRVALGPLRARSEMHHCCCLSLHLVIFDFSIFSTIAELTSHTTRPPPRAPSRSFLVLVILSPKPHPCHRGGGPFLTTILMTLSRSSLVSVIWMLSQLPRLPPMAIPSSLGARDLVPHALDS